MARRDFDFTKALRSPVDQIPAEIIVTVPDGTVSDPVESFRDVELRLAQHELIDEILRNDPDLFTETRQSSDDNRESHMDDPIFMQQRRKVLESTLTKVVKPRWK